MVYEKNPHKTGGSFWSLIPHTRGPTTTVWGRSTGSSSFNAPGKRIHRWDLLASLMKTCWLICSPANMPGFESEPCYIQRSQKHLAFRPFGWSALWDTHPLLHRGIWVKFHGTLRLTTPFQDLWVGGTQIFLGKNAWKKPPNCGKKLVCWSCVPFLFSEDVPKRWCSLICLIPFFKTGFCEWVRLREKDRIVTDSEQKT